MPSDDMNMSSASGWCYVDPSERTEGEHQDVPHRLRAAHRGHGWAPETGGRGLWAGQPMTGLHSLIDLIGRCLLKIKKQHLCNKKLFLTNCNKSDTSTADLWCSLINYRVDFCLKPWLGLALTFMADAFKLQMIFHLIASSL